MQVDVIYNEECLEGMNRIDDHSIDMILCDLPYGTTACKWDIIIPFEPLWKQYKRVIKKNGAIVLFGSEPFSSYLRLSNIVWYKYDWIWRKNRPTNFAHAKNKPMKAHEIISIFSEGTTVHKTQSKNRMPYYPQGLKEINEYVDYTCNTDTFFSKRKSHGAFIRTHTGYPHTVLEYSTDMSNLHPTGKPVALVEYLIKTYTNENEVVLDNCIGSGTTAIAAINTNRGYIGYELDADYYQIAIERIRKHNESRSV